MRDKNKLVYILLSVLLLSSIVLPVIQAKQEQVNWINPIDIAVTGQGLVFGKGQHKIIVSATIEWSQGEDIRQAKWNPNRSANSKTGQSRVENLRGSGFEMDFYVQKDVSEIKFDLYATQDISVALTVSGLDLGNYVFRQGRLTLNMWDVFSWADNFSYDPETQTIYFTMTAGERIDPLISFDEVAGTYVYRGDIENYAPAVVIPAAYGDNATLHVPLSYNNNGTTLQDWQLVTAGNYVVIDSDSVSFEWILENLRQATSPGLADNATNVDETMWMLENEKGDVYWSKTGAGVTIANTTTAYQGSTALNITLSSAAQNDGIYHLHSKEFDISGYSFIGFAFKGDNTGDTWEFYIGDNAVASTATPGAFSRVVFDDDSTQWKAFAVPLVDDVSSYAGSMHKTILRNVEAAPTDSSVLFDFIRLDNPIFVPSEFYIGDNTTSISVFTLNSTGQDPRILFEWDVNGTTDASIYPGNLRNLEDEWLGSIAKQNATDWTLKANTTLPAGTYGEFLINMSVWLPSGATRMALPADVTANKLWPMWNPEKTISLGNHWSTGTSYPHSHTAETGSLATINDNAGTNIVFHNLNYALQSSYVNGEAIRNTDTSNYAWNLDLGLNTYSYSYYVDNDNPAAQNATIEVWIPDLANIVTYTLSYWNGSEFEVFMDFASGTITQPKSLNQTTLDAAMYLEGMRTETKAIVNSTAGLADIGSITYSTSYGVMSRFGYVVELLKDDGVPEDGADEILIQFNMTYISEGAATYEFSGGDADAQWGLDNIDGSAIELFDATASDPSPYLILLMAQKPDALWVTANAAQQITAVEFNATGNYKVLVDTALGTETTTAPTGETIQLTADRWNGYYKNIAQFDRGERTDVDVGEGDAGFGWTYTSYPGMDQKVAFKVPLAPWQNATEVDVDSGRSQMMFRAVVNMGDPQTYSYTVDLSSNTEANFVLTLLSDFQRDSYNIGPLRAVGAVLPMVNSTITFTDPRTGTPYSFVYISQVGATVGERQDVDHLTINGAIVQSKVVPVGIITAGAGPTQNITVHLGVPDNPVVDGVTSGNLTSVLWNSDVRRLTVVMNRTTGQSLLVVDDGGLGKPTRVTGGSFTYDADQGLVTVTLTHASPRTANIYWQNVAFPAIQGLNIYWQLFPIIVILGALKAKKEDLIDNKVMKYIMVFAAAVIVLTLILNMT